jgi:RNA polymerase sigma factor (sigma-70 family)
MRRRRFAADFGGGRPGPRVNLSDMSTTETHASVIRGASDPRNTEAWDRFHAAYRPLLRRYVFARSRNLGLRWGEGEVEEVVQDVFIKLFRRLPTFVHEPTKGRFRTYLHRVVINAISERGGPRRAGTRATGGDDLDLTNIPDRPEPDDDGWIAEYRRGILAAVLPEVRAKVEPVNSNKWASFERHVLGHRPAAEVAAELGIKPNLVYQNASRVLADVRRLCLETFEEGLEDECDELPR